MKEKVTLNNGVQVYPFSSFEELLDTVRHQKKILVAINAEKILHATDQTREIINNNIGYCDGTGSVMALKKHGANDMVKIAGCELWLKIVEALYKENKSFYLVGSKQEVIEETVSKLKQDYEGIRIVNYRNGYLSPEEETLLIEDIAAKRPDVVFVAMGSPKQELLMDKMSRVHEAIYQGLGGSFDVYTGHVERAPKWWVDHNLELNVKFFCSSSCFW